MSNALKVSGLSVIALAIIVFGGILASKIADASAPTGLIAAVATTTLNQAVTAGTAELLFATSTSCSARTIGTQGGNVVLSFSDVQGSRAAVGTGFVQLASTTVTYDSGLFGCGAVYVYPEYTGTIAVQEAR